MGKFRSVVLNMLRGFAPILSTQDIDRIVAQFGSTTDGVFNVSVNQLNTTYEEVEPVLPPPESATLLDVVRYFAYRRDAMSGPRAARLLQMYRMPDDAWQGIMAKAITHQRVNTQSFADALAHAGTGGVTNAWPDVPEGPAIPSVHGMASEGDSKLNFAWIPTELHQEDLGSDAFGMIEVLDHLIDPPERHRKAAKATARLSSPPGTLTLSQKERRTPSSELSSSRSRADAPVGAT